MYQHFILVASSYARGERVGFHLATEGQLDHVAIEEKMQRLSHINRDDVGVHSFVTDSADWQSVIELDSFLRILWFVKTSMNLNSFTIRL
ncbi:hypothetical protein [Streptococcus equi]|uniref:hypothetical protein n=1 Tax=Streptococcus equi TaxID=1336 RepID=UPI001E5B297F|nr:hypothetical protein [Streptococcus equi]